MKNKTKLYLAMKLKYALLLVLIVTWSGCNNTSSTENNKLLKNDIARHTSDMANFGVILLKYAYDNNGKFPSKLSVLYDDSYCKLPEYFVCQNVSNTPLPNSSADIENGACDYYYFGNGFTVENYPSNLPIVVTKPNIYPDNTILLLYKNCLVIKKKTNDLAPKVLELIRRTELRAEPELKK